MSSHPDNVQREAVVAVIVRQQRLLVIERSATVRAPGKLCFPGGGVEKNETLPAALIREMREELGLRARPRVELWQSQSPRGTLLHWWLAERIDSKSLQPEPSEVAWWGWMTIEQMQAAPNLLPSNAEFLTAYRQGEFEIPSLRP